jgi:hypothetical protein
MCWITFVYLCLYVSTNFDTQRSKPFFACLFRSRSSAVKFWKAVRLAIPNVRHDDFGITENGGTSATSDDLRRVNPQLSNDSGNSVTSATGLLGTSKSAWFAKESFGSTSDWRDPSLNYDDLRVTLPKVDISFQLGWRCSVSRVTQWCRTVSWTRLCIFGSWYILY